MPGLAVRCGMVQCSSASATSLLCHVMGGGHEDAMAKCVPHTADSKHVDGRSSQASNSQGGHVTPLC